MNILPYLKVINILNRTPVVLILTIIYCSVSFPTSMREINSNKEVIWKNYTSKEVISMVILITTGDEKYKSKNLSNLFKETQIIHLLVISGSNIIVFLQFINIFIVRKRKINYVISILMILTYLKYTGYPQTLLRALISYSLSEILSYKGLRFSTSAYLFITVSLLLLTYIIGSLGTSFYLSACYSVAIIIFNRLLIRDQDTNKLTKFLIFNIYITAVSYFLFYNYHNFSSCNSFVANIFITTLFEPAVLFSYLLYFLPTVEEIKLISETFKILFKFLEFALIYIGFIRNLTYNICYEQ